MEKAIVIDVTGEIYHKSCFELVFANEEGRPEFSETRDFESDDECDYCAGPLLDLPDDLDDVDSEDEE